ncbi:FtsX-like permease family protein [Yinghuangia seranimata]|uniref:FtsX-like permease family protein n=1 Tax=Yinghuangia seranimata TaxID=408067 RepID=UPI00248B99C5|nr:ABC transporter permease [Yinghuangia seranimata]MDI2124545.1 FtsX-like permease family protein [Yinghuangia seranimata]
MRAVLRAVGAAVRRKRAQTVVVAMVVLLSTATTVLSAALMVASHSPFDRAVARLRGAHATVAVDAAKATAEQVRATAAAPGVTAMGGPYPMVSAPVESPGGPPMRAAPSVSVVGRSDSGGPVDHVVVHSGRWARAPGEVVLSREQGDRGSVQVGDRVRVGGVDLTVVGLASSVTGSAGAWTVPEQVTALGGTPTFQVLYRFASSGTDAAVRAGVDAVRAALPADAVLGAASYREARQRSGDTASLVLPFVTAFSVLGIVMSVLIVANVVSGAVVAGYQRIGVFNALGFTPRQVGGVYVAQMMLPAAVGAVLGAVVGHVLALPLLADTATSFAVPEVPGVAWWADTLVPAAVLLAVGVAAIVPAVRAGRLPAARAISSGRAPKVGRGFRAHRWLGRSRLPRAVGMGLATPFARPARTAMTLVALLLGSAAVTFAYGLTQSLERAEHGLERDGVVQVEAHVGVPVGDDGVMRGPAPSRGVPEAQPSADPDADPDALAAVLRADADTARFTGVAHVVAAVPGRTEPVNIDAYSGDSSWLGYPLVSGRWFAGAGEVVAPTPFLRASALEVGDSMTLEIDGRRTVARIVGEVFVTSENRVFADAATLAAAGSSARPDTFQIQLRPGASARAYANRIATDPVFGSSPGAVFVHDSTNGTIVVMLALAALLTLILAVVAGLGVFNTVLLNTRERARDIGVLKSLGMTPAQTLAMVVTSVAALGLVGGLAGIPLGVALHDVVVPHMADTAQLRLPESMLDVYGVLPYTLLTGAGLLLAVAGALAPATWAAKSRTATALRVE